MHPPVANSVGDSGVGAYLSGEYGYQWLGTSDAFYGNVKFKDYGTWNVGIGFTASGIEAAFAPTN